MKILQVVGYKNSGKTTLIEKWLEVLQNNNLRVSVIKHHGHGGPLEMPSEQTDSMKFLKRGAVSSLAIGNDLVQVHLQDDLEFEQLVAISAFAHPDVILVEGFKKESEPKVVIVRSSEDWETLRKLTNIQLVVVHDDININDDFEIINRSNQKSLDEWIIQKIKFK